jgi:branched-chain amino acid transport system ATP-binding protein
MLKVDNLGVGYGDLQVVWDVSFEVPDGSLVAIIGSNGAGKTTTLRALMGLLPLISGEVEFDGESIVGAATHKIVERGLVMIPESRATFASLSVADNLELGAYTKRARAERKETLDDVYGIFPQLADRGSQFAGTLSGGERQMLAIGKALMARPEMLILDEPSLGLAPLIVEDTFEAIRAIRQRGVSVLMVEQHVELTLEMVDYAYVLELGHVVIEGPSTELRNDQRVREAYLSIS